MKKINKIPRREFLSVAGLGALGATLFPKNIFSNTLYNPTAQPAKISLQLYTVRDQIKTDIEGTLRKLKSLGVDTVETAFWPDNISVKQAGKYLKDAGLKVSSSHIELPLNDKSKAAMLEVAETFNSKKMIWHGWPEDKRYSSLDGTKELIGIYNEANHFAKSHGLQFGLHNHWWEYRNRVGDRLVYQWLLESVEPDVFFEIDTYWVKVAGYDPAKIVAEFGKRAQFLHIKDGPAKWNDNLPKDNPDPMVPVGKGTQNFPAIVKAANGNTEWMVIEMDKTATDVFAAIHDSYQYLEKNNLGKTSSS
ncbi:MAG: sugar phosphate isomerase/epimerase [Bacteroidetes bacterium]|nr:sugar phosphate isomerase/epimerase [Bacteroidota bacterium]